MINRAAGAGAAAGVGNDYEISLDSDFLLLPKSVSSTNTTNSDPRTTRPEVAGQAVGGQPAIGAAAGALGAGFAAMDGAEHAAAHATDGEVELDAKGAVPLGDTHHIYYWVVMLPPLQALDEPDKEPRHVSGEFRPAKEVLGAIREHTSREYANGAQQAIKDWLRRTPGTISDVAWSYFRNQ